MNNWRLLLVAVVAIFQPIASFTEQNLIDGRQECCDRRSSNSIFQDVRLHETYRKIPSEERDLSPQDNVRDQQRYESRIHLLTRSRERLLIDDDARRFPTEISVKPKESTGRVTRFRESRYNDGHQALARNRMLPEDIRSVRFVSNQLDRPKIESREIQRTREENHRVSRRTASMLKIHGEDIIRRETHHETRNIAFGSENGMHLGDMEYRNFYRATKPEGDNRRTRSAVSEINHGVKDKRVSQRNTDDYRNVNKRREQREQNRILRDNRHGSYERTLVDQRRNQNMINVRKNDLLSVKWQHRDEHKYSNDRYLLRESRIPTEAEHRLDGEFVTFGNSRSERIERSMEITHGRVPLSRDRSAAERWDSRFSRTLQTRLSEERLARSRAQINEKSELSRERVPAERESRNRIMASRRTEKQIREESTKTSDEIRLNTDERRQYRDHSRMYRVRTAALRQFRDDTEIGRQGTNSRLDDDKMTEQREYRIRARSNIEEIRRDRGDYRKSSGFRSRHIPLDIEERRDREVSRTIRYDEGNMSNRIFIRNKEAIRNNERADQRKHTRSENRARERTYITRLSRELFARANERETRLKSRESRTDPQKEMIRNRGMTELVVEKLEMISVTKIAPQRRSAEQTAELKSMRTERKISYESAVRNRDETRIIERQNRANQRVVHTDTRRELRGNADKEVLTHYNAESQNLVYFRLRNVETAKDKDNVNADKDEYEKPSTTYLRIVFYTLQGAYLCGLLIQLMTENSVKEKTRIFGWWTVKDIVKVD